MSNKPTILLVEDDPLFVLNVEDQLIEAGFTVFAALHGDAAIAEISSEPGKFACLVTDIRLGTATDGWAVARHARSTNPEMGIVYMSGGNGDWASQGLPGSVMLTKPFAIAELTAVIDRMVDAIAQPGSSAATG